MKHYVLTYRVTIKAEDEDAAELISADLEGDIMHANRRVVDVGCDPYMEEVE